MTSHKRLLYYVLSRFLEGEDDHDHDHHDDHEAEEEAAHGASHDYENGAGDDDDAKPWGDVILAAFLINLATLSGLIVTVFTIVIPRGMQRARRARREREHQRRINANNNNSNNNAVNNNGDGDDESRESLVSHGSKDYLFSRRFDHLILPSFAAGALMATAVFLIIPESLLLLEGEGNAHGEEEEELHDDHAHTGEGEEDAHHDDEEEEEAEGDHDGHDHLRRLIVTGVRFLASAANQTAGMEGEGDHAHDDHDDEFEPLIGAMEETEEAAAAHASHDDSHGSAMWKFGVAILAGYLLPFLLASVFPAPHGPDEQCEACRIRLLEGSVEQDKLLEEDGGGGGGDATKTNSSSGCEKACCAGNSNDDYKPKENDAEDNHLTESGERAEKGTAQHATSEGESSMDSPPEAAQDNATTRTAIASPNQVNWSLTASILLGDFFHNFTDGIFVGNAFLFCERSVAYAIVAATLYHEFAQEIADFCLLTQHCHLRIWHAFVLNFLSGFSVLIGALLILAMDMSLESTGAILAMSAGVYIYISSTEIMPRIHSKEDNKTTKGKFLFFVSFACGAVPIGLVLLNHGHGCEDH